MKQFVFVLLIFMSFCSNAQWVLERQFDGNFIQYVTIIDTNVVWAVGLSNQNPDSPFVALRTPIVGWVSKSIQGLPLGFLSCTCIAATDSINAWIGTSQGKVFRTSDGGETWGLQLDAGGGYVNDIQFSRVNATYGYIFCDPPAGRGTPFKIFKTSNSGSNWVTFSPLLGSDNVGFDRSSSVTDSAHAWFGLYCETSNCTISSIAYTTNGGINWSISTLMGTNGFAATDVEFKDDNLFGLAASNNNPTFIEKTTNNGNNWFVAYTLPFPAEIDNMVWIKGTSVWYYSNVAEIRKSSNDGLTWSLMSDPHEFDQINYMDAVRSGNKIYGWAVTNGAKIMKLIDTIGPIGIQNISSEVPRSFSLLQNYPNPFNPTTKIKFSLPKNSFVNLVIYDLQGRKIETIVNEALHTGTYSVNFDGSKIASGIYFYKIEAGTFIESKKMVLLK